MNSCEYPVPCYQISSLLDECIQAIDLEMADLYQNSTDEVELEKLQRPLEMQRKALRNVWDLFEYAERSGARRVVLSGSDLELLRNSLTW